MNEIIPRSGNEILIDLLKGQPISNEEHIALMKFLDPVFYKEKGFMSWVGKEEKKRIKKAIADYKELLIQDKSLSPDDIVDKFATQANQYNQGWQLELYYKLYKLILDFEGNKLKLAEKKGLSIIQKFLRSTDSDEKSESYKTSFIICRKEQRKLA